MKTPLYIILLLCACWQNLSAQKDVFKIGFIAGLNTSQIYTPNSGFYERSEFLQKTSHGLNAGVLATMQVSKNGQLGVEFLFSQNGKYVMTEPILANQHADIFVNYLEIPIHYNWQSNLSNKVDFNNFHFEAGVAYAHLLTGTKFVKNKLLDDPAFFDRQRTLLLQSGMTFFLLKNFGLNLKASVPVDIDWTGLTFAGRLVVMIP